MKKRLTKKSYSKFAFYMILITLGIITTILASAIGMGMSQKKAQNSLNQAIHYLKNQCLNYDEVLSSDETKSLMRLTEKVQSLSYTFSVSEKSHTDKFVKDFVKMQRLECVFVLNKSLKSDYQYGLSKNEYSKWKNIINGSEISSIAKHPEKVYATRTSKGEKIYDIAAAARKDAPGVIFAVRYQSGVAIDSYQFALEDMLAGYETTFDGMLYITDGKYIIGSNDEDKHRKKVEDISTITALDNTDAYNKLTRFPADGEVFYGGKSNFRDYKLYAVFEQFNVLSFFHSVVLITFSTYMVLMLFVIFIHNRIRNRHLEEISVQYEIVRAVSKIYLTNILVDPRKNRLEFLYGADEFPNYSTKQSATKIFENTFFPYICDEDRENFKRFCDFSTLDERLDGKEYIEFSYRNYRGEWLNDMIIPNEVSQNGKIVNFLLVTKSIDQQKKNELEYQQKLKQSIANEARANKAKTDFLRQISHDVRTPINVILGMMDIGDKNADDPKKLEYCRNKTREAANFLLELVNDILTINKLDSGKLKINKKPFVLTETINKIFSIVKNQANSKGVLLDDAEIDIAHDRLIGDPLSVQQILLNILSNSVKYSPADNHITLRVEEIPTGKCSGSFKFICIDNGIGMSEAFQKHLFEPFAQESEESQNNYGGIGLGLAVVKKLTDKMGGTINVASQKNIGTTFEIAIPFEYDMSAKSAQKAVCDDHSADIGGMNILVAEDNKINMEIAEYFLKSGGAAVTRAQNGKDATDIFAASAPGEFDVILMDMMMPVMDGVEATRTIRAMDRADAKTIPIVAMTANLFEEDINECKNAGMNGHIPKPISADKLIKSIAPYKKEGK